MKNFKYAYYGLGQSNTYLALKKYLLEHDYLQDDETLFHEANNKTTVTLVACKDIDSVKASLKQNQADYALIPIVNSDSGIVSFSSKMLFEENFEVVKIMTDKVYLSLYGLRQIDNFSEVKRIISNLPALGQCSHFVNKNMPFAVYDIVSSTTDAVKKLIDSRDLDSVCIANQTAEENKELIKISNGAINQSVVSNDGVTETKYLLIKKREQTLKGKNIYHLLPGYYIYQSKSGQAMKNSVSPASLRVVEIKCKKDLFTIQGFLFGFTCEQLFSSNSTALSIEGDNCYFYYNYDNKHEEQTVNGLTCLTIHLPTFSKNGRMKGIYCGYCNNKAGTLEFVKISKEEFDIYMGGFYEER